MDFNQIYKAPSVPKLNKKNISSSVLRGASAVSSVPRMNRTAFSFLRPAANIQGLDQSSVADALVETNRILVEIQKQLALDFASRIVEEKDNINRIKKEKSKKRFLSKENALEKISAVGSGLTNQVNKILSPAKSIFEKIIEFFKVILTGMVMNTAFKWLQDPKNREALGKFFAFLVEHWQWVVGIIGTVILVGVISQLAVAIQGIVAAFTFICSPLGLAALAALAAVAGTIAINQKTNEFIQSEIELSRAGKISLSESRIRQIDTDLENKAPSISNAVDALSVPDWVKLGIKSSMGPFLLSERVGKDVAKMAAIKLFENMKFSSGGVVSGKGSDKIDTVPAMLAPGEYVVRGSSTKLFKPFLSDINENAGRLFDQFKNAVIGLSNVVNIQKETSEKFNKILDDFNNFLESKIAKNKNSGIGGGIGGNINIKTPSLGTDTQPNSASNVNLSNISINNNISSPQTILGNAGLIRPKTLTRQEKIYHDISTKRSPRQTIIPIDLPPVTSKLPKIPTPTRTATDVPNISSVNTLNPYMQLTPYIYGILV